MFSILLLVPIKRLTVIDTETELWLKSQTFFLYIF